MKGPKITLPKSLPGSRTSQPEEWSPYEDNGGTAAAIAGKGYVIIGADTRLNGDYCVHTRDDDSKLFQLTRNTFLASGGMQADRLQLQQILKHRLQWYEYNNGGKTASTPAIAQLLSSVLYQRRFFPLYTFNIVAGLDENGNGVCYSYDAVGCTEPLQYGTTGTGSAFIEPLMDCIILHEHQVRDDAPKRLYDVLACDEKAAIKQSNSMSKDEALQMLKNAFTGAAERDCFTGDAVQFIILTANGIEREVMQLRKD